MKTRINMDEGRRWTAYGETNKAMKLRALSEKTQGGLLGQGA